MKVPPAAIHFPEQDRRWILEQIEECLVTGALTLGKHGKALEDSFAERCRCSYAVAVNSGTSALEIILRAIGVKGREVIVPTNTFFATPAAVLHSGGLVRFADCDRRDFAIDTASIQDCLGPQTAAVIVVHIGGIISPRIDEIRNACDAAGVPLIEDAAHAHGSALGARPAGSFGRAAAFSFYPTKVMTSGEGGIIVTNDEGLYREAVLYRDQGKEGFTTNFHVRLGYNWRMSEPHAIIGLAQLRRLDEFIQRRREIAQVYDRLLPRLGRTLVPVEPSPGAHSNYYKYIAMLNGMERPALKQMMREKFEVGLSGEVYEVPCHLQPVFQKCAAGPLPKAENICANHVCLPVSARMTQAEARYVVDCLEEATSSLRAQPVRAGD